MFKKPLIINLFSALFLSIGFINFANSENIVQPIKTDLPPPVLAHGKHSMIATNNPLASKAAQKILDQGGSAVDAAIAAGFVLGLTEPQSSGIGGGGYALTYNPKNKKMIAYDVARQIGS